MEKRQESHKIRLNNNIVTLLGADMLSSVYFTENRMILNLEIVIAEKVGRQEIQNIAT